MYLFSTAYPAAQKILGMNLSVCDALAAFQRQARSDYPKYDWSDDLIASLAEEIARLVHELSVREELLQIPSETNTFVILLWDDPMGAALAAFQDFLVGRSEWTNEGYEKPLWEGLEVESNVLESLASNLETWEEENSAFAASLENPARSSYEVYEMLLGLVFWGLVFRELLTRHALLCSRSLWVSHLDSEHGILITPLHSVYEN